MRVSGGGNENDKEGYLDGNAPKKQDRLTPDDPTKARWYLVPRYHSESSRGMYLTRILISSRDEYFLSPTTNVPLDRALSMSSGFRAAAGGGHLAGGAARRGSAGSGFDPTSRTYASRAADVPAFSPPVAVVAVAVAIAVSVLVVSALVVSASSAPPSSSSSTPKPPPSPSSHLPSMTSVSSHPPTCTSLANTCGTLVLPDNDIMPARLFGCDSTSMSVYGMPLRDSAALARRQCGHPSAENIVIRPILIYYLIVRSIIWCYVNIIMSGWWNIMTMPYYAMRRSRSGMMIFRGIVAAASEIAREGLDVLRLCHGHDHVVLRNYGT